MSPDSALAADAAPDARDLSPVDHRISNTSPLAAGCGAASTGTVYPNSEIQPILAADPTHPSHLIAVYQQDRWSAFGANGQLTQVSNDFGGTWTAATPPKFSRCTGGTVANGGDFEVATDAWVTISPSGTAFQATFAINRTVFETAMLVSRSTDGGLTWGAPKTVIREGDAFFNDRPTVTADPTRPGTAYLLWDRVADTSTSTVEHYFQPTYLSKTTDDGLTWSAPRVIYDPGVNKGTVGVQLVVLPNGTLVVGFQQIEQDVPTTVSSYKLIRSTNAGSTWSPAITVGQIHDDGNFGVIADPDGASGTIRNARLPLMAADASGVLHGIWSDNQFATATTIDVVYASSHDGGLTWSPAVKINKSPAGVSAVIPTIAVTSSGTIGVTYYDFRNNDVATPSLPTDFWQITCGHDCADPTSWKETHLTGPFDARGVPVTRLGLMLGDYTGLATKGDSFISVLSVGTGDPTNPTDLHSIVAPPPN